MKKNIYKKMKVILIFLIVCCNIMFSFFSYYSLAEVKFKDLQKKAADLDGDGNINYKDMEILVDQKFPQRPVDGVKNQSGEGYLVDLFAQSTHSGSSSVVASGDVIKVLMLGNSYTYFGNTGGILAELAHRAGYRIIVQYAVNSYFNAEDMYKKKMRMLKWDYSGDTLKTEGSMKTWGDKKRWHNLSTIANTQKHWDYVILQDYAHKYSYWPKILKLFQNKGLIDSTSKFVVNAHIRRDIEVSGINKKGGEIGKKAKAMGASVVYTGELVRKSISETSTSKSLLHITKKNDRHPSAKSQYINATALYAKIFGKDKLANSKNSSSLIKAYNSDGGTYDQFVKILFHAKVESDRSRNSIKEREAKAFQYLVYKYYEQYVN